MAPADEDEEYMEKFDPVLIIAPASVMHNWCNELDTWGYFVYRFLFYTRFKFSKKFENFLSLQKLSVSLENFMGTNVMRRSDSLRKESLIFY